MPKLSMDGKMGYSLVRYKATAVMVVNVRRVHVAVVVMMI